jgi:hypothetical protein
LVNTIEKSKNTEGVENEEQQHFRHHNNIKKKKKNNFMEQSVDANPPPKAHTRKPAQAVGMRERNRSPQLKKKTATTKKSRNDNNCKIYSHSLWTIFYPC